MIHDIQGNAPQVMGRRQRLGAVDFITIYGPQDASTVTWGSGNQVTTPPPPEPPPPPVTHTGPAAQTIYDQILAASAAAALLPPPNTDTTLPPPSWEIPPEAYTDQTTDPTAPPPAPTETYSYSDWSSGPAWLTIWPSYNAPVTWGENNTPNTVAPNNPEAAAPITYTGEEAADIWEQLDEGAQIEVGSAAALQTTPAWVAFDPTKLYMPPPPPPPPTTPTPTTPTPTTPTPGTPPATVGGAITTLQQSTASVLPAQLASSLPKWLTDMPLWQTGGAAAVGLYMLYQRQQNQQKGKKR